MATRKIVDIPTRKMAEEIAKSWRRFGCKTPPVVKQPNGKWTAKATGKENLKMATRKIVDIPTKKMAEEIAKSWRRFGCKTPPVVKQPNGKWTAKATGCPG